MLESELVGKDMEVCTYPQEKGAEHVEHYGRLHGNDFGLWSFQELGKGCIPIWHCGKHHIFYLQNSRGFI